MKFFILFFEKKQIVNREIVKFMYLCSGIMNRKGLFIILALVAVGLVAFAVHGCQRRADRMRAALDSALEQNRNYIMFVVDDLKYLVRGGRLNPFSGAFGTLLDIKPILYLNEDGKIVPLKKVRTRKRAVNEILRIAKDLQPDQTYMYVVYTYNRADA